MDDYPLSAEEAADLAAKALARMGELGVTAHPHNFTIWFNYFWGQPPGLAEAVDRLSRQGDRLTEAQGQELFLRFFASGMAASVLHDTGAKLEEALSRVMRAVDGAEGDAGQYKQALDQYSGRVDDAAAEGDARQALRDLAEETRRMREVTGELEDRLRQSSEEVRTLKRDLEHLRQEAMTDPLTGLANRKAFDLRLRDALAEMDEPLGPSHLSILMIDIDFFKRFNDRFGHQTGDLVLRLVGRILQNSIKGQDLAARYGGEEFVVLLPRTALKGAHALADGIRRTVADKQITNRSTGENLGTITLSIGVAERRRGESGRATIGRADKALYMAKAAGRNRVVAETGLKGG